MTSKDLPIDTEQGASEKPQSGNKPLSKQVDNLLVQAANSSGNEFAMGYDDSGCFWRFYAGARGAGSMMGEPVFHSESPEPLEALKEYLECYIGVTDLVTPKPLANQDMANPPQSDTTSNSELREQLEEFALHLKPGTTKGKHRTAIFDTLELTKLVQALIAQEANKAYEKGRKAGIAENQSKTINNFRKIDGLPPLSIEEIKAQSRSNDE